MTVPSFRLTRNFNPTVVSYIDRQPRFVTIHLSVFSTAGLSFECSRMIFIIWLWYKSSSTWFRIFSAIMLAVYCFTAPSGNSTSYKIFYNIGMSLCFPMNLPSKLTLRWNTLASHNSPPWGSNKSAFIRASVIDIGCSKIPYSSNISASGTVGATSSKGMS